MKNILFVLLIIVAGCQERPGQLQRVKVEIEPIEIVEKEYKTLVSTIRWETDTNIDGINVKSTLPLKRKKIRRIRYMYNKSKRLFFNKFENKLKCNPNNLGPLEIRIISADMLRDKRYFPLAGPRNFGRYFTPKTIYIIHEVYSHPEYLAHELAHYFYDRCGIGLDADTEQNRAYRFQDLYRERN